MEIVGREAWVRQQERAQAMDICRIIPTVTTSRLLLMASQMTAVLHQFELPNVSVEEDSRMLKDLVVALDQVGEDNVDSIQITEALAVALLSRAWSAWSLEEQGPNKELGSWNTWNQDPGRGLAAIEKLGWEIWIPVLLPWLPQWYQLGAILLPSSSSPHLAHFLITSLAHHAEHALLSHSPQDAIPTMKGLDTYLLQSQEISSVLYGSSKVSEAWAALQKVLDSWLAAHLKQPQPQAQPSPRKLIFNEELFQTVCQLRTRLALCFSTSLVTTSSSSKSSGSGGVSSLCEDNNCNNAIHSSSDSPMVKIEIEEIKRIWHHILSLDKPQISSSIRKKRQTLAASKNADSASLQLESSRRLAIGLAAHAAVSSLFLQESSYKASSNGGGPLEKGTLSSIFSDPNPVCPVRVTLAALSMLEYAAIQHAVDLNDTNDYSSRQQDNLFLFYAQSIEILPFIIWTVSGLVESLQQKQELLEKLLKSESSNAAFPTVRALLEHGHKGIGTLCTINSTSLVIPSFHQWAYKESIALSNLVHTEESSKIIGEEGPGMDAAVHAVFPASLLCPDVLLKVLINGAAGQQGKAVMLAGILHQLPNLKSVKRSQKEKEGDENTKIIGKLSSCRPILIEILRKQLQNALTTQARLSEDQRSALQHCIVTLCSPPPTFDSGFSSSVASAAVSPDTMLESIVLPTLHQAAGSPIESAQDLAMLLKLARLLVDLSFRSKPGTTIPINTGIYSQLSTISFKFLEFSSRRIDLSPLGLLLPREVFEEAYPLLHQCGGSNVHPPKTPSGSPSSLFKLARPSSSHHGFSSRGGGNSVNLNLIWELNDILCTSLATYIASSTTDNEIPRVEVILDEVSGGQGFDFSQMKDALVIASAVMLPCCAAEEASKLYTWLAEVVEYILKKTEKDNMSTSIRSQFSGTTIDRILLQGAVIEVLCHAMHALAFVPGLIPIAGEELPIQNTPSQLRSRAVARFIQHLSIASQAAINFTSPTPADAFSLKSAIIARIFKEISKTAASMREYYDVSTLHVCLMQLVHVLRQEMAKTKNSILPTEMKNIFVSEAKETNDPALSAAIAALM